MLRRAVCCAALVTACASDPVAEGGPQRDAGVDATLDSSADAPGDAGTDAEPDHDAAPPPWDDDTQRLAHCTFEEPVVHAPRPAPALAALQAGVATRFLELPIGTPLGGYGARSSGLGAGTGAVDARARRWCATFLPSAGQHDTPRADALALDVGGERLVFVRIDAPVVLETTLYAVERALGPGYRGHVVISASHSHAAWAGWPASLVLVPGMDRPRKELHDLVVSGIVSAAEAALAALEPAKIGLAVGEGLDPTDAVSHDRRDDNDDVVGPDGNEAGKSKDPEVWALRVDRANGAPLGALFSVPLHGTVGEEANPVVSTDGPGAVARGLTSALGYPVFHVQGAAGDVSPRSGWLRAACPDDVHCLDYPRLEVIAAESARLFAPLVAGVQTSDQAALEIVTRSFYIGKSHPVTRPDAGQYYYPPFSPNPPDGKIYDDAGRLISPIDEFNVEFGAALCGDETSASFSPIPGLKGVGAYNSCADLGKLVKPFSLLFKVGMDIDAPPCDAVRTTSTAIRLVLPGGDQHLFVTVPGEPTAPFTSYLRGRSPLAREKTHVIGYAQDYIGYVLTAEDWLSGGYEPSLNLWGPLEGEEILDGILEGAAIAATPAIEDPEVGSSRFDQFEFPPGAPVSPVVTSDHGTVPATLPAELFLPDVIAALPSAQPASQVERAHGVARFVWLGGDAAIDYPVATIEVSTPSGFVALQDAHGAPASSRTGQVVITYTPDPIAAPAPDHHYWVASWQPVPVATLDGAAPAGAFSLPAGTYRFAVSGSARASSGTTTYTLTSDPFTVTAATLDEVSVTRTPSGLSLVGRMATAPGLRALLIGASDVHVPLPGPWTVLVTYAGGATSSDVVTPDAAGNATLALVADPTTVTTVDLRDASGNGATVAVP